MSNAEDGGLWGPFSPITSLMMRVFGRVPHNQQQQPPALPAEPAQPAAAPDDAPAAAAADMEAQLHPGIYNVNDQVSQGAPGPLGPPLAPVNQQPHPAAFASAAFAPAPAPAARGDDDFDPVPPQLPLPVDDMDGLFLDQGDAGDAGDAWQWQPGSDAADEVAKCSHDGRPTPDHILKSEEYAAFKQNLRMQFKKQVDKKEKANPRIPITDDMMEDAIDRAVEDACADVLCIECLDDHRTGFEAHQASGSSEPYIAALESKKMGVDLKPSKLSRDGASTHRPFRMRMDAEDIAKTFILKKIPDKGGPDDARLHVALAKSAKAKSRCRSSGQSSTPRGKCAVARPRVDAASPRQVDAASKEQRVLQLVRGNTATMDFVVEIIRRQEQEIATLQCGLNSTIALLCALLSSKSEGGKPIGKGDALSCNDYNGVPLDPTDDDAGERLRSMVEQHIRTLLPDPNHPVPLRLSRGCITVSLDMEELVKLPVEQQLALFNAVAEIRRTGSLESAAIDAGYTVDRLGPDEAGDLDSDEDEDDYEARLEELKSLYEQLLAAQSKHLAGLGDGGDAAASTSTSRKRQADEPAGGSDKRSAITPGPTPRAMTEDSSGEHTTGQKLDEQVPRPEHGGLSNAAAAAAAAMVDDDEDDDDDAPTPILTGEDVTSSDDVKLLSMYQERDAQERDAHGLEPADLTYSHDFMQVQVPALQASGADSDMQGAPPTPMLQPFHVFLKAVRHYLDPLAAIANHPALLLHTHTPGSPSAAGSFSPSSFDSPPPSPTPGMPRPGRRTMMRAARRMTGSASSLRQKPRRSVLDVLLELLWWAEPRLRAIILQALMRVHRAVPMFAAAAASGTVLDFREYFADLEARLCSPLSLPTSTLASAVENGLLARPDVPTLTFMRVGSRCDKTKMANLLCAGQANGPFISCDNEDPAVVDCLAKKSVFVEMSFTAVEMLTTPASSSMHVMDDCDAQATHGPPPTPVKVVNAHGDIGHYPQPLADLLIRDTTTLLVTVRLEEAERQPEVAAHLRWVLECAVAHRRKTELWLQLDSPCSDSGTLYVRLENARILPLSRADLHELCDDYVSLTWFTRTESSDTLRQNLVAFCNEAFAAEARNEHEHEQHGQTSPASCFAMDKLLAALQHTPPGMFKSENLPLHGKDYFCRFAELARKRLNVRYGERSCDMSLEEIEAEILNIETDSLVQAHALWRRPHSVVQAFYELVSSCQEQSWQDERHITRALAVYSKPHVQGLEKKFNELSIELHHAEAHRPDASTAANDVLAQHDQRVAELSRRRREAMLELDRAMLGLEHFWRELGQHYRAWHAKSLLGRIPSAVEQDRELERTVLNIPRLRAQSLLDGVAVELMDGDASFVAIDWIKPILLDVSDELRIRHGRDVRVAVVSCHGLQSSGKSTLLNALFGVSFPTAASRCSRGISMQLVRVCTSTLGKATDSTTATPFQAYDYVLVLDTEGLESNLLELDAEDRTRDQRMVALALAVSNVALFNVEGIMVSSNMAEMLKVAIAALLQTKEINLTELEMFVVHQKVEPSQWEELRSIRSKFTTMLDTFTRTVSKDTHNVFSDLVAFDSESNVAYLPPLFHERAGVQVTNASYGREVQKLLTQLLTRRSMLRGSSTLDAWAEKLSMAWKVVNSARRFGFGVRSMMQLLAREKVEHFASQLMEPGYEFSNSNEPSPGSWVVKERELLDAISVAEKCEGAGIAEQVRNIVGQWIDYMDAVGRHRNEAIEQFFHRENNPELDDFKEHPTLGPSARIANFLKGIREYGLEHIRAREIVCGLEKELQDVQKALTAQALAFANGGREAGMEVSDAYINEMIDEKIISLTPNKRDVAKEVHREFNREIDALTLRQLPMQDSSAAGFRTGASADCMSRAGASAAPTAGRQPASWTSVSFGKPLDLGLIESKVEMPETDDEMDFGVPTRTRSRSRARSRARAVARAKSPKPIMSKMTRMQSERLVKALSKRTLNFFDIYFNSAVEEIARQLPELRKRVDDIITRNQTQGVDVNVSSVCASLINCATMWCETTSANLPGYRYSEEFKNLVLVSVKMYVEPRLMDWHEEWWKTNSVRGILAPGSKRRERLVQDLLQIARNIDCNKLAAEHLARDLVPKLTGVFKSRVFAAMRQGLEAAGHLWARQKDGLLAAMQYRALLDIERNKTAFVKLRVKAPQKAMRRVLGELVRAALATPAPAGIKDTVPLEEVWAQVWSATVERFLEIARLLADEQAAAASKKAKDELTLQRLLDRFEKQDAQLFQMLDLKAANGALPIPSPGTFVQLLSNAVQKEAGKSRMPLSKDKAPGLARDWAEKELVHVLEAELLSCPAVCPYCAAVCMLSTTGDHDHDHHTAFFHQPSGLGGVHSVDSKRLCTMNCCEMVAKDTWMRSYKNLAPGQEHIDYKMSAYADYYPTWCIPDQQDGQASSWEPKIVMASLNESIAGWYGVEPAHAVADARDPTHSIPSSWKTELCAPAEVARTKERLQRKIGFDQWCSLA